MWGIGCYYNVRSKVEMWNTEFNLKCDIFSIQHPSSVTLWDVK